MKRTLKMGLGFLIAAACSTGAMAQWGTNSTNSLIVGDSGDVPQIVPTSDGGCYIAWQGSTGGTQYNAVHLQRLNSAGHEIWPHNGIVAVAGDNSASFVGDFNLAIASDGAALIVSTTQFTDTANPSTAQTNVQKFAASDGHKLWGTGGHDVALTTGSLTSHLGAICSTPDGGCIAGYTLTLSSNNGVIRFMRVTPAGVPAWTSPIPEVLENSGSTSCQLVQLLPAGADGSFVALWGSGAGTVGLHTSKFTGAGALAAGWGSGTLNGAIFVVNQPLVIDTGGMTNFNFYQSRMITDGAGGAIYGWSSFANSGFASPTEALLQHISSAGVIKFGKCCDSGNNCTVTTAATCAAMGNTFTTGAGTALAMVDTAYVPTTQGRYTASVAYNQTEGSYFMAAGQGPTASGQVVSAIAQKYDSNGNRLYTPAGFVVIPQSSNTQVSVDHIVCTATSDGSCIVMGNDGVGSTTIDSVVFSAKVALDNTGYPAFVWNKLINSDASTSKGRNGAVVSAGSDDPILTFVWNGRVAAARISAADGSPGVAPVPLNIDTDVPTFVTACVGDTVMLSIAVSGTPTISYQWQRHFAFNVNGNPDAFWVLNDGDSSFQCTIPDDGTTYSGTNTNTLIIHNVQGNFPTATCPNSDPNLNEYRCYVFDSGGNQAYSSTAQISVTGGACCASGGGDCTFTCDGSTCAGTFQGQGTVCQPNPCGGACCTGSSCTSTFSAAQCSGTYQGDGSTCAPSPCPGSCCDNTFGSCTVATVTTCLSGNTFSAGGTCDTNPCPQPGACCNTITGACTSAAVTGCSSGGQQFQGVGTVCDPDPCPPLGACCNSQNQCVPLIQSTCTGIGNRQWLGANTTCDANPCAQPSGVCCRGSTCITSITSQQDCSSSLSAGATAGAVFAISGTTCNAGSTSQPCCYADYNKANGITVQDIFDFLTDWFAGRPYAHVGGNGTTDTLTVQNIFDFLSAWFAGGC